MKLCVSTLGCPDWSFTDIISNSKDLGFDGIEVRGIGNETYVPSIPEFKNLDKEEMQKRLKGLEIAILTSAAYLHLDDKYIDEAKKYIDTAKKFSVKYIRVLGDTEGKPGIDVDVNKVKNTLIKLNEYADGSGVKILIETNGIFANSVFLKDFLNELNLKNVGVIWDINHPFVYFNEKPDFTYNNLKNYIEHVHVKDSVFNDGKISYKIPGQGNLPIFEIVKILKENAYQGYLSFEWLKRWNKELEDGGIVFAKYKYFMDDILSQL